MCACQCPTLRATAGASAAAGAAPRARAPAPAARPQAADQLPSKLSILGVKGCAEHCTHRTRYRPCGARPGTQPQNKTGASSQPGRAAAIVLPGADRGAHLLHIVRAAPLAIEHLHCLPVLLVKAAAAPRLTPRGAPAAESARKAAPAAHRTAAPRTTQRARPRDGRAAPQQVLALARPGGRSKRHPKAAPRAPPPRHEVAISAETVRASCSRSFRVVN
jgi:hypothetical protein